MSRPIINPRREPPLNYLCCHCGETSDDFARLIDDDFIKAMPENQKDYWEQRRGEWECGHCGEQMWRKPVKRELENNEETP